MLDQRLGSGWSTQSPTKRQPGLAQATGVYMPYQLTLLLCLPNLPCTGDLNLQGWSGGVVTECRSRRRGPLQLSSLGCLVGQDDCAATKDIRLSGNSTTCVKQEATFPVIPFQFLACFVFRPVLALHLCPRTICKLSRDRMTGLAEAYELFVSVSIPPAL